MHIFIDTYGVWIDVDEEQFQIRNAEQSRKISPYKLSGIHLYKPCSITTPALLLAAAHEIPVLIYDHTSRVQVWTWSHKYGSIADLRVRQAFYSHSDDKNAWIKHLISMKIDGQRSNLAWIKNRVPRKSASIELADTQLRTFAVSLADKQDGQGIRSMEALSARIYWDQVFDALGDRLDADKRYKRGAEDAFNGALNYCYGILYGWVESSLLMKGLDPYMGLHHVHRYDKPALAFDHIEPFRPWAEKYVMQLFLKSFFTEDHFVEDETTGAYLLTSLGKKTLITGFLGMMEERSYLNGQRIKRRDHIHHLSTALVNILKKYPLP